MPEFLNRLAHETFVQPALREWLLDGALGQFCAFTLVLVRMTGLMTVGPVFGQSIVPANVRVLLVVALSLLITPSLPEQSRIGFHRLDANGDGQLSRGEVPEPLQGRFDALLSRAGKEPADVLSASEFAFDPLRLKIPASAPDYLRAALGELAVGLMLGVGVLAVLSGLQLAGQLIDQQTGLALGGLFNPGLDMDSTVSGQMLYLLGTTAFLAMEPFGGHLQLTAALLETFQTLPVGEAYVSVSAVELLRDLVHQSLVLAVQVAAPVLAVMSLLTLTMGFLGQSLPQVNVFVIGFPMRAIITLIVLAMSLSGAARAVVDLVPAVIDQFRFALGAA